MFVTQSHAIPCTSDPSDGQRNNAKTHVCIVQDGGQYLVDTSQEILFICPFCTRFLKERSLKMSFRPAGAEDSDSDDEGFYMGSSYTINGDRDKHNGMNSDVNLNSTVDSQKNFVAMPAGAESDEDSKGLEFSSAPVSSVSSSSGRTGGRKNFERQHAHKKTNDGPSHSVAGATGLGRGRGQLQQGRGRGGFPKPPSSYSNRGKTTKRFVYHKYIFPAGFLNN